MHCYGKENAEEVNILKIIYEKAVQLFKYLKFECQKLPAVGYFQRDRQYIISNKVCGI